LSVRALFDLNVLISLFEEQHVHYLKAHYWWEQNLSLGWASCPLTQNGFLRVLSQPSYQIPVPLPKALQYLSDVTKREDHTFWPDDLSLLDDNRINHERILGPKQLTDIYLLALAVKHGGRLVTFDRRIPIAAVRGAKSHHVAVI
jgi:toxin-antitoxin system PIN domain toxin